MDESKTKHPLLRFISEHPLGVLIGFIGAIASIAAFVLTPFPWLFAPKRNLSACVNPFRTAIVQTAKRSDIGITYKGIKVSGDVIAVQIAIWNAGRESIKRGAILAPIIL